MKPIITLLLATLFLGCASLPPNATPAQRAQYAIQQAEKVAAPTTAAAVTGFLLLQSDPVRRATDAAYVYSAATALYTFSSGTIPSPDQVQSAVAAWSKGDSRYVELADLITSQYASLYPLFNIANVDAVILFQNIGAGAMNGAKPFLTQASQ